MKRILTVLVLLVIVSLVGFVPAVQADGANSQPVVRHASRSTEVVGSFYGPAGDPDGMGTGNGVVDPPVEIAPSGTNNANAGGTVEPQPDQCLQLVLILVQLLVY